MFDNSPMRQRIEQWDARHGADGFVVGGWVLFSDGAMRENSHMGAMVEPPAKPWERAKAQLRYWEARLQAATSAFGSMKANLRQQAKNALKDAGSRTPPSPPSDAQLQELLTQQEAARLLQQKVAAARENVSRNRPSHLHDRERSANAFSAQNEARLREIEEITI